MDKKLIVKCLACGAAFIILLNEIRWFECERCHHIVHLLHREYVQPYFGNDSAFFTSSGLGFNSGVSRQALIEGAEYEE
jgi:DNA-directed RNA polymerase subunit RPC12/RpoP